MSKAEIIDELSKLATEERREILERLCILEETEFTAAHQALVDEALASGPAQAASQARWQQALERGLARAAKRS
jgi:hypothetical protein